MKSLWKVLRGLMTVTGFFLIYAGASTSDYYVLELGQSEPNYIWLTMAIGIILMLPSLVHAIVTGGVQR